MIRPRTSVSSKMLSPELLALRKAAQDAKSHAHAVGAMLLQGRATEAEKAAAFAAMECAFAAADAKMKEEMAA